MGKIPRRNHTAAFKARVALEALKEERAVIEIAGITGLHPDLVTPWKRQLQERASEAFEKERPPEEGLSIADLNPKIGQPAMGNDLSAGAPLKLHETSAKRRSRPHLPCRQPGSAASQSSPGPPPTAGPSPSRSATKR